MHGSQQNYLENPAIREAYKTMVQAMTREEYLNNLLAMSLTAMQASGVLPATVQSIFMMQQVVNTLPNPTQEVKHTPEQNGILADFEHLVSQNFHSSISAYLCLVVQSRTESNPGIDGLQPIMDFSQVFKPSNSST